MATLRLPAFFHPQAGRRNTWPEATATVADCISLADIWKKGRAVNLYTIRFTYWVNGQMFSGCFKTEKCLAPGDSISVRYDPHHPERNSADPEDLFQTGMLIAGSVVLVVLYFLLALHR